MEIEENIVSVTGNIKYERVVPMGIAAHAHGFILNNMIKMYANPYEAVLREYTSNAIDAHRVAGQTRPVEVTLPNELNPNLTIRDWGVGMSADDLDAYGQFGDSTKRKDNVNIGGFGLGSKSGLAIAANFTVTSIKDGKQNTIVVGRDTTGAPTLNFLAEKDTDKPNGTTITVPSSQFGKFRNAIQSGMFIGHPRGTILIDGKEPKISVYDTEHFAPLGDDLGWMYKGSEYQLRDLLGHRQVVNLSGVVMPIDMSSVMDNNFDIDYQILRNYLPLVIMNIPNGSVELLRSREGLVYEGKTRLGIQAHITALLASAVKEYQVQIDAAPNWPEAFRILYAARSAGFNANYTYRNEPLEPYVLKIDPKDSTDLKHIVTGASVYSGAASASIHTFGDGLTQRLVGSEKRGEHNILVTDGGVPVPLRKKSSTIYHEAYRNIRHFIRVQAAKLNINESMIVIHITSKSLADLPEKQVEFYQTVLTSDEVIETTTAAAREWAAEARRARKATAPAKPEDKVVGVLTPSTYGGSATYKHKVSDLDPEMTYVILRNESDDLFDRAILKGLLYRRAYYDLTAANQRLVSYITQWSRAGDFHILHVYKNEKIDHLAAAGVKTTTLKDAVQASLTKNYNNSLTPLEAAAALDQLSGGLHWAGRLKDKNVLGLVVNEDTRKWLSLVTDTKLQTRFEKVREVNELAKALGFTTATSTTAASATYESRTNRYPLLSATRYDSPKPQDVVNYINMVDAHLAAQA